MKPVPLIHTSWLKPFADYFATRRIELRPYYEAARIEAKQVTSGEGWITKHQLYLFLNGLAEGEKMPEVGFLVGETITPDKLGSIGEAMAQAETLGGVMRTFCQLINRHVEENRCWLEEGADGEVWLFDEKLSSFEAERSIADHAGLMSMINLARLVGGPDWYPQQVKFQTGPTTAYRKVPGMKSLMIEFDQPAAGFSFPASWLLQRVHVVSTRRPSPGNQSGLLEEGKPIVEKIRLLLEAILGVGGIAPTVNLMAELCNTSPRSLHRQLKESGTSYRQLMDDLRLNRAKALLAKGDLAIKEIAHDLGYSGTNNFTRAFHRLAGVSPGAYRSKQRVGA